MNKNSMLLVLAAAAALYVMSRRPANAATAAPVGANPIANNVNNQLWAGVLGGAWTSLVNGGDVPFLKRNYLGQVVTSNGTPIDTPQVRDAMSPIEASFGSGVNVGDPTTGVDYLEQMGW